MIVKKNIFYFISFATLLITSLEAKAESWEYQMRGYLSARLLSYTEDPSKNYGQMSRAQIEQTTKFSTNLVALNQLRWTSNSIASDFSTKSTPPKKEVFEAYLGENYLKYKSANWVLQLGYQEVIWGEAFGFNYADIIGPKDLRATLLSDAADARLPLLLFNGKYFFTSGALSGSLQLLFSPEPRFSRTLPLELFTAGLFPQSSIMVIKEKTPDLFKTHEFGGKLSASYAGTDMSLFSYSYLSRDPHYSLESASLTNITLKEEHAKVQSYGLSLARTIFSDFVFRTDIVQTQKKLVNDFSTSGQFITVPVNSLNALISLDTPPYKDYSGTFIFARSNLKETIPNSFKEKNEQYVIGRISKKLGSDKTVEISYIHELEFPGKSIQTFINWPITSSTDLKFGGEFYFGDERSNLQKLKNISSVFFSIKNYFQL